MTSAEPTPEPLDPIEPTRAATSPAVWVLATLALLTISFSAWRPAPAGVWHDDGVYMMIGQALADGDGLVYGGVPGSPPAAKFPPLYSALLALLWLLFGDLATVTLAAGFLNLALVTASGLLLGRILHQRAGVPAVLAALGGILAFASGDVLRHAIVPLSESLFVFLSLLALSAWPKNESTNDFRAVSLTLVALALTRSAAIAFIAGAGLTLLLQKRWKATLFATGPALATMLIWGAWSRRAAAEIPGGMEDILGPYTGWLSGQLLDSPAAFLGGLPSHAFAVLERVAVLALPRTSGGLLLILGLLVAPLLVLGMRRIARDLPVFVACAALYFGLLLAWPYADRRLVVPLHPLVTGAIIAGGWACAREWRTVRWKALLTAGAAAWILGYSAMSALRIADGWPSAAFVIRTGQLAPALEALERIAPPDAIVGAPELWPALALHGGWSVIPSARFRPAASDSLQPVWGSPDDQIALWRSARMTHLVLEQGGMIHGAALDSLQARCPGSVGVVAAFPPQQLVRLDWDRCG